MVADERKRYIKHIIDPDLWCKARARALLNGMSLAQWFNELIRMAIELDWSYSSPKNNYNAAYKITEAIHKAKKDRRL